MVREYTDETGTHHEFHSFEKGILGPGINDTGVDTIPKEISPFPNRFCHYRTPLAIVNKLDKHHVLYDIRMLMSLKEYHKKRDFKKTKEPKGKVAHDKKKLFVIQKHAASHLHYDFRLELNGVLLSWAVPKGPCFDSNIKRLAMHVEDHPVDYGSFEGIIPKGQYGGGTVMLWDTGVWHSLDDNPAKAYQEGHLRFELEAHKLKGRWDLFRFKEDNQWFLKKYQDEFSTPLDEYDVTIQEPLSVVTQRSIEEIRDNFEHVWSSEGAIKATNKRAITNSNAATKITLHKNVEEVPFPEKINPQLATLVDKAPEGEDWLHEIKFDGYRILAFINKKNIVLKSRNQKDWTQELEPVAAALKQLKGTNLILDGEVVLLDEYGKSDFQLLQNTIKSNRSGHFIYYVFDILYYDKYDVRSLPLIQRKELLRSILPIQDSTLYYSDHIINDGDEMFHHSCELSLEGIISKRVDSTYETKRSKSWLKVKCIKRQEFVLGGYTDPQGGRSHFGSLCLGVYNEQGELEYSGNVGTGFTQASLKEIYQEIEKHQSEKNPFKSIPPDSKKAHWLKPVMVAEVEFTEWTKDNHLRHPSFKGLRLDKAAHLVKRELVAGLAQIKKTSPKGSKKNAKNNATNSFAITNPDKILYPEDKITKKDMLIYYETVAEYILPFIKNRPLSLVRCPEHYNECFFQRHTNRTTPKSLHSIDIESKEKVEPYIYLDNREGLLSLVQMGVLEIHPWGSTIQSVETPDVIVIDLDPAPDVAWEKVVAAAKNIKDELGQIKLEAFVKTTGGKGLHVVIPVQPEYNWDAIKHFTHVFVLYLEKKYPANYISKMTKSQRGGKIFVDYLRNQRSSTAIAAYSSRSRIHAPVSVPLAWSELTNIQIENFWTIKTLPQRLNQLQKDPWEKFWQLKQHLPFPD